MADDLTLEAAFQAAPIIAIVRGVTPDAAVDVAEALYAEGVRIVEIPLNSPDPLESLRRVVGAVGDRMVCGSGTVLDPEAVDRVADAGGRMLVGTPTEALAAYRAGARWLKLFPAVSLGPAHLRQTLAVLAKDVVPIAVGGVGPAAFGEWFGAGARGFGLGSELYRAGDSAEVVAGKARTCMSAITELRASGALSR